MQPTQVLRWVMLGLTLLAFGCRDSICDETLDGSVAVDLSSVRPTGHYLYLSEDFALDFDRPGAGQAQLRVRHGTAPAEVVYTVESGAARTQTEMVLEERVAGGRQGNKNCTATYRYRQETWTVTGLTLRSTAASRDGKPLALEDGQSIASYKASQFKLLELKTHFIDRKNMNTHLGMQFVNSQAPGFDMFFTRTGQQVKNGL